MMAGREREVKLVLPQVFIRLPLPPQLLRGDERERACADDRDRCGLFPFRSAAAAAARALTRERASEIQSAPPPFQFPRHSDCESALYLSPAVARRPSLSIGNLEGIAP